MILIGGTALARCYLQHRASYDLDFFVNARFDPLMIQRRFSGA
ncbi:MAG: nucleotidyl transferase AbiEii/AbiGii toxin family protein [Deltaproteobacteria bacterium]